MKRSSFAWLMFCVGQLALGSAPEAEWKDWAKENLAAETNPAVQNRTIHQASRLQILGPFVSTSDRRDLYQNFGVNAGVRYHLTDHHAWEILRAYWTFPTESSLVSEIRQQTNYRPDAKTSNFQLATSYVYTPIYGKYAWGADSIVHFDVFATLGGGLRFSEQAQPFLEIGVGMSHYLWKDISIIPEVRFRGYREQRTKSTLVGEAVFQIGVGWLL